MKTIVCALLITLATTCAPPDVTAAPSPDRRAMQTDPEVLSNFLGRLPLGSRIRVDLKAGGTIKGTLMSATAERIVLQRRTRIPEPAHTIPVPEISNVEIEHGGGIGKAIAIGAAAGAGAAIAVLLIVIASVGD